MATSELACTYAALILSDDGLEITAENILAITKAANVEVEPYWPGLFAKLFAKKSVEDLISSVGSAPAASAGAAAPAGAAAAAPAAKKEEKKEEKPESDEDMGFSLFD